MAQQRADELVREIRARRRGLRRSVDDLLSTNEIARRVRDSPWKWLAGGAAAGVAAGRFLPRPVLEGAKRSVVASVGPRVKTAILGLVTAALGSRGAGDAGVELAPDGAETAPDGHPDAALAGPESLQ
jgi:hypothetical protein